MKRQLISALVCLTVGLCAPFALAGDTPAPAKKLVIAKKSMAEKGSFHVIHIKNVNSDCDDCHTKGELPADTVMLRLHDKLAKGDPGPVNHETCYDCHSRASKPLPFYVKK